MHFAYPQKVLFRHCDPAGIVFFPRYAEMVNDAVEALFADRLGWPFETMHPDAGVPTAAIDLQFKAPSRHGDTLTLEITIAAIGGSSMKLRTRAACGDETRFTADQTIVCINATGRPQRWPEDVRARATKIMEAPA